MATINEGGILVKLVLFTTFLLVTLSGLSVIKMYSKRTDIIKGELRNSVWDLLENTFSRLHLCCRFT